MFFACPCDRVKLIRSAKNVLIAFFVAPYLLLLTIVFIYLGANVVQVLVHAALMGFISHLVLQIAILADPELPFSRPVQKRAGSGVLLGLAFGATTVGFFLQALSEALYRSAIATTATPLTIVAMSAAIDRLTRARVERRTHLLEFGG